MWEHMAEEIDMKNLENNSQNRSQGFGTASKIVFFQVKDSAAKIARIVETSLSHFQNKESLLILVPDFHALEFVDNLLWRHPEESFLPHAPIEAPSKELIAITCRPENLNQASFVFNLRPSPLLWSTPPKLIYELEDFSSPEKKAASHLRFQAYRNAGYPISSS